MSLGEYRDRVLLQRFFENARRRRLDDLLEEKLGHQGFGKPVVVEAGSDTAKLYLDGGVLEAPVLTCPATQERYFFASLPVGYLRNDVELQPRALEPDRLWELYRHLRTHTQLAPAVCRLVGDQLLLFDGQHKAAAQVSTKPRSRVTSSARAACTTLAILLLADAEVVLHTVRS